MKENDDNTEHVDKITENSEFKEAEEAPVIIDKTEAIEKCATVTEEAREHLERKSEDNIEIVHAVGTFRNSPNIALSQDDIISLEKYIYSEEHLKKNITNVEFDLVGPWEVQARLFILKDNLWEGVRSYVWKHLGGQNFWDRSNGTKIKLERIHVK